MSAVKDWLSASLHELKGLSGRAAVHQGLNFLLVLGSALAIWKGLMTSSASESPIVVVLSGSMEPAYYRGDLLFLWNDHSVPLEVGEVMVFKLDGRDTPIVHRILEVRDEGVRVDDTLGSEVRMLTKGDNNEVDDRGLYNRGQVWLSRKNIIGRARL